MADEEYTLSQRHPDESPGDVKLRREVLLVAQVALLGEISAAVRGVTLDWSNECITLRAIIDGEITDDDRESMEAAASEIVASFPRHEIAVETLRVDVPIPLAPRALRAWVYQRKE